MDKKQLEQFQNDLQELHIVLTSSQIDQFFRYYEMLIEKNKVVNLTAITALDEVLKKHFIDSLSLVKACDLSGNISLLDIGTGAGFPGIPLKIAFPNLQVTLLDSLQKRVNFLQEVTDSLELENVTVIHGRAEDFAKPDINFTNQMSLGGSSDNRLRECFDLCVSRAVANLSTLSEYCLPYVRIGGSFISYKSEKANEEIKQADHSITILGGKTVDQIGFTLPGSDIYRNLVVIKKCKSTPKQYPRKAGTASRKPL